MFEVKIITKQFEKVRKQGINVIPCEIKSEKTEPIAFSLFASHRFILRGFYLYNYPHILYRSFSSFSYHNFLSLFPFFGFLI